MFTLEWSWCCNAVQPFNEILDILGARSLRFNSLVSVSIWGGGEVELHDCLELGLVAAVFESGVVVVTAEHVGLVVWEAWAMETKVVPALLVRIGFAHPVMGWQGCKKSEGGETDTKLNKKFFKLCRIPLSSLHSCLKPLLLLFLTAFPKCESNHFQLGIIFSSIHFGHVIFNSTALTFMADINRGGRTVNQKSSEACSFSRLKIALTHTDTTSSDKNSLCYKSPLKLKSQGQDTVISAIVSNLKWVFQRKLILLMLGYRMKVNYMDLQRLWIKFHCLFAHLHWSSTTESFF